MDDAVTTMRNLIQIMETTSAISIARIRAMFRAEAWETLMNNLSQNESELAEYVENYEDETGEQLNITMQQEMMRGGELNDPKFTIWLRNVIEERADEIGATICAKIKADNIIAWRAVEAPPGWNPRAGHVGVHWSFTQHKAQPIFGDGREGNILFIIKAKLPISSIDWNSTIAAELGAEFGEDEDEIRLYDNAPYQIIAVSQRPV